MSNVLDVLLRFLRTRGLVILGAAGAQSQGLAPGVGADVDAVVDGGGEELVEFVDGLEVEGEGPVIA